MAVNEVVAYTPDLLDRSKVGAAAPGTRFLARAEELAEAGPRASVLVVDLVRPGALEAVLALPAEVRARCLAYANHTRTDLIEPATEAGCGAVLARSEFFGRIAEHIGRVGGGEGG